MRCAPPHQEQLDLRLLCLAILLLSPLQIAILLGLFLLLGRHRLSHTQAHGWIFVSELYHARTTNNVPRHLARSSLLNTATAAHIPVNTKSKIKLGQAASQDHDPQQSWEG